MLIALSQIIDQGELLATLGRYLESLIPGQSPAMIGELARFLDHRAVIGWALLVTMIFFSSLAFTVLENAMSVIFLHRVAGATFWSLRLYPIATSSFWGWAFC